MIVQRENHYVSHEVWHFAIYVRKMQSFQNQKRNGMPLFISTRELGTTMVRCNVYAPRTIPFSLLYKIEKPAAPVFLFFH